MFILTAISDFARRTRAARHNYLTQRQIQALPLDVQKDIGWPVDQYTRRAEHPNFRQ